MNKARNSNSGVALTVLVDGTVNTMDLKAEFGFSILIEKGDDVVLFDTGRSGVVLENARKLGVNLSVVQAIVLSHGHADHTGGLLGVLDVARDATVYAHPDIFQQRYIVREGEAAAAGAPFRREDIESRTRLVLSDGPIEVVPGIRTTGTIPRTVEIEQNGSPFFLDRQGENRDDASDDMALFLDTEHGVVVVAACSHAGAENILEHVANLAGSSRIYAIVGGLHLDGAPEESIQRAKDAFRRFGVERIALAHCTGILAVVRLFSAYPDRCFLCSTGVRIPL